MASQISGTITRKSNGSLEFTPADAGTFNQLPAMGDEVTVTIDVTRTAAEIERAHATAKTARTASAEVERADLLLDGRVIGSAEVASTPAVERRARK